MKSIESQNYAGSFRHATQRTPKAHFIRFGEPLPRATFLPEEGLYSTLASARLLTTKSDSANRKNRYETNPYRLFDYPSAPEAEERGFFI